MKLTRRQFEYTCRFVATSFAAPVDVTNGTSLSFGGLEVVLFPERRYRGALHMLELRFVCRSFDPARSAAKL